MSLKRHFQYLFSVIAENEPRTCLNVTVVASLYPFWCSLESIYHIALTPCLLDINVLIYQSVFREIASVLLYCNNKITFGEMPHRDPNVELRIK